MTLLTIAKMIILFIIYSAPVAMVGYFAWKYQNEVMDFSIVVVDYFRLFSWRRSLKTGDLVEVRINGENMIQAISMDVDNGMVRFENPSRVHVSISVNRCYPLPDRL